MLHHCYFGIIFALKWKSSYGEHTENNKKTIWKKKIKSQEQKFSTIWMESAKKTESEREQRVISATMKCCSKWKNNKSLKWQRKICIILCFIENIKSLCGSVWQSNCVFLFIKILSLFLHFCFIFVYSRCLMKNYDKML